MNYSKYKNTLEYPSYELKEKRAEMLKAYREEEQRLHKVFAEDLKDEYDVSNNPKAALLFEKAWELGYDSGLGSVENYFAELVELIQ